MLKYECESEKYRQLGEKIDEKISQSSLFSSLVYLSIPPSHVHI